MRKPNLILGTAQFGSNYGITNKNGKITLNAAKDIFNFCKNNNIKYLDTAQDYGDSEKTIGLSLTKNNPIKIFSKTKKINNNIISVKDIKKLEEDFYISRQNLRSEKIYGLLIHSIEDLKKNNSNLVYEWLISLKKRNLVNEIGLSIYDPIDLEGINLKEIDVIQFPFNLYNQDFILNKSIRFIKKENCRIQVRSVFLQGLLLNSHINWPSWINQKHLNHHKDLEQYCLKKNYSLLDLNLAFIKSFEFINDLIIGISSLEEIENFMKSWKKKIALGDFNKFAWHIHDKDFIDPRGWPKNKY